MARAVRKVSRVSTKNQKKEGLNKKLIAIISAIAAVVVIAAVSLIVYFTTKEDEVYVSEKVYFVGETYGTNKDAGTVTFEKENYYNIVRKIQNQEIQEHVFIFAYDGSAFYADEEDEANYNKDYEKLIATIADLQLAINALNNTDVVLYVIDVNVNDRVNAALMTDAANLHEDGFAAFYSSTEDTVFEPAFFYLHEGEVKKNFKIDGKKLLVSTSKMGTILSTSIYNTLNFLPTIEKAE